MKLPSDLFLPHFDSQGFDVDLFRSYMNERDAQNIEQYQSFLTRNPRLGDINRMKFKVWVSARHNKKAEIIAFEEFSAAPPCQGSCPALIHGT